MAHEMPEHRAMFPSVQEHPTRARCIRAGVALLVAACAALRADVARGEAMGAGPAPAATMNLQQALDYARAHQPSLQAAQARAQAAIAETAIPRAQWFPKLGASAQALEGSKNNTTASYLGFSTVDIPRIGGSPAVAAGDASWSPYGSSFAGVGLRQEVFDFGKIAAQSAIFDAVAQAQKFRAQAERLNLDLGVKEAFFAVLAGKAILATATAAYQRSKEERDYAAAGVHSGLRSPIDLTRAEADLMRLDAARIRASGSLTAAQGVFAAVVGYPGALLDAAGEPAAPPPPPELQGALKRADAEDPDIQDFDARLRAQQARTRATLMELLPDLSLSSTLSGRNGGVPATAGTPGSSPTAGFLPGVPNWDVGLVLTWQIFDEGILARRSASQEYEKAAAADLAAVRLNTSSAIEQGYAATEVALQAIPALQRSVEAAKDNYAQAQARFRAGLGTAVELADAEAVRTDAEIQLALGQFEYARARARLARAIAEEQ